MAGERNKSVINLARLGPVVAAVALAGSSFALACLALSVPAAASVTGVESGGSVAETLFGSSRSALGGHFYLKADEYFHRGVGHTRKEALRGRLYHELGRQISPQEHVHLSGDRIKEIMPWMWLGIRMDPTNPELYLVASYWLSSELERPDVAIQLLREGVWNIPFCYPIQLEMGRLFIHLGRLDEARDAFRAGLAFWPGTADPADADVQRDRAAIMLYLAFIEEAQGDTKEAAALFRELASSFPRHASLAERAAVLESGGRPEVTARESLTRLAKPSREHHCEREDEHEDAPPAAEEGRGA